MSVTKAARIDHQQCVDEAIGMAKAGVVLATMGVVAGTLVLNWQTVAIVAGASTWAGRLAGML